jgi:hypothetical protein
MALSVYAEPGGTTRITSSGSPNLIYAYAEQLESGSHDVAGGDSAIDR